MLKLIKTTRVEEPAKVAAFRNTRRFRRGTQTTPKSSRHLTGGQHTVCKYQYYLKKIRDIKK